jgi:uncharacterized phage protein (TIGR02218 family)
VLTLPTDFATALQGGDTTHLCRAFELERVDGEILRFTDAQVSFTADGDTFEPGAGISVGALQLSANGASGELTVTVAANGDLIELRDLLAGVYDGAQFRFYLADHQNPAFGLVAKWRGWVDRVEMTDRGEATMTLRGLLARTHFMVTERFSPVCRAFIGDARCGINLASFTHTATVVSVSGLNVVLSVTGTPSRSFALGSIVPTSGRAKGKRIEIKAWNSGTSTATCFIPFGLVLEAGDTVQIMPGCAYNVDACVSWNNILNYRGEPYAFGQDALATGFSPVPWDDPETAPARPGRVPNGDLVVIDQSSSTLTLQFSDYGQPSDYYYQYRINGGDAQTLGGTRIVTGLDPSTTYQLEVRPVAYAGDIVGDWSNVAEGTTEPALGADLLYVHLPPQTTLPSPFNPLWSRFTITITGLGTYEIGASGAASVDYHDVSGQRIIIFMNNNNSYGELSGPAVLVDLEKVRGIISGGEITTITVAVEGYWNDDTTSPGSNYNFKLRGATYDEFDYQTAIDNDSHLDSMLSETASDEDESLHSSGSLATHSFAWAGSWDWDNASHTAIGTVTYDEGAGSVEIS